MTATTDTIMFSPMTGAMALLSTKGVFREAALYAYRNRLYAATKNGYLLLLAGQRTSVHSTSWRSIDGVEFIEEYNGLKIVEPRVKTTKLKVAK